MADIMSENMEEFEEDTQEGKYMVFKSGRESYGLELQYVNEIIQLQPITGIPETENYMKGFINLRGRIIPVIDVSLRFRQNPIEYNDRTCIVVLNVEELIVGLIVEQIADVVNIDAADIDSPPSLSAGRSQYVYGIGKTVDSVVLLLDPRKLIGKEDLKVIEQLVENAME